MMPEDLDGSTLMMNVSIDSSAKLYVPAKEVMDLVVRCGVLIKREYEKGKYQNKYVENILDNLPSVEIVPFKALQAKIVASRLDPGA